MGSQEEITIYQLAKHVADRLGSSSEIVFRTYEQVFGNDGFEDMRRRVPDLTRIGQAIGWEPTRNLDQIIDDVARNNGVAAGAR